jgi:hypothetical protein
MRCAVGAAHAKNKKKHREKTMAQDENARLQCVVSEYRRCVFNQ